MRRKSDTHGGSTSSHASSFSIDDESLTVYFEEKQFFSAFYEFSQGSGPIKIWEYGNSNDAFMRFIVNTPPPDLATSHSANYGHRITNIISKFEDQHYIALYSQVLDCQARGFTRSVVLVVANQSPEIIKYIHEAYINELTNIIDQIYQNSYKLFINEVQGYSLSLLKTANATNSPQLKSKLTELKSYLPYFGINIDKIIQEEEEHLKQPNQGKDSNTTEKKKDDENSDESNSSQKKFQLDIHGEIKDELFFTKIDNNLRFIEDITNFNHAIVYDLQDLIGNLPTTETNAAIAAHIDIGTFRYLPIFNPSNPIKQLSSEILKMPSDNLEKNKANSTFNNDDRLNPENYNDEKATTNFSFNNSGVKNDSNYIINLEKDESKKVAFTGSLTTDNIKPKKLRKLTNRDKDTVRRKSEIPWKFKQHKKGTSLAKQPNRRYGIDYAFDFNFGGFKDRYSQLVTNVLNTNYDMSVFTLQWLVKFKVFHYCAFTILSGGTLVILTSKQDTTHGKSLADRFSLLAPFSLIREQKKKIKINRKKIESSGELKINVLDDEEEDDDDGFYGHHSESEIILVKDSVEPRECFKYSIVVTNNIIQTPLNSKDLSLDSKLQNLRNSNKNRKFPIVTTFSNKNDNDAELLSVLDLTTNVYKGDGCPDASFVMNELGKETTLHLNSGLSACQSISNLDQIQQQPSQQMLQTPPSIPLKNAAVVSSSSSSFAPSSSGKKKAKSNFNKQTVNSPPSPLSISSEESPTKNSPTFAYEQSSPPQGYSQLSQATKKQKNAPLRCSSSSIITTSSSTSRIHPVASGSVLSSSAYGNQPVGSQSSNQNSMLVSEIENESEFSISETENELSNYSNLRRGLGIGTYGGMKHGKRSGRVSFMSESSTISSSASVVIESSESENLFVLNMYSIINMKTANFVQKLAELSLNKDAPSRDELLRDTGFASDDEPILKYWIYCFFNKQKCRPVLLNNKSSTGLTVIPMYK